MLDGFLGSKTVKRAQIMSSDVKIQFAFLGDVAEDVVGFCTEETFRTSQSNQAF